jgi:hypothetical protein
LEGKEKRIKNYGKWAVKPLQKKQNGKVTLRCRNERKFQAKQKKTNVTKGSRGSSWPLRE